MSPEPLVSSVHARLLKSNSMILCPSEALAPTYRPSGDQLGAKKLSDPGSASTFCVFKFKRCTATFPGSFEKNGKSLYITESPSGDQHVFIWPPLPVEAGLASPPFTEIT